MRRICSKESIVSSTCLFAAKEGGADLIGSKRRFAPPKPPAFLRPSILAEKKKHHVITMLAGREGVRMIWSANGGAAGPSMFHHISPCLLYERIIKAYADHIVWCCPPQLPAFCRPPKSATNAAIRSVYLHCKALNAVMYTMHRQSLENAELAHCTSSKGSRCCNSQYLQALRSSKCCKSEHPSQARDEIRML